MKVQEVILRALAKKITWWQAAEIIPPRLEIPQSARDSHFPTASAAGD
jgi:hypothetical protein